MGRRECTLEVVQRENGSQVQQRSRRRRNREAMDTPYVPRVQTADMMNPYAWSMAGITSDYYGHFNPTARVSDAQVPEPRRAAMTDDAPGTARQQCRRFCGAFRRDRMTDEVDAAVQPVQPPQPQAAADRAAAETCISQLPRTHDAALSRSELRDRLLSFVHTSHHNHRGCRQAGLDIACE